MGLSDQNNNIVQGFFAEVSHQTFIHVEQGKNCRASGYLRYGRSVPAAYIRTQQSGAGRAEIQPLLVVPEPEGMSLGFAGAERNFCATALSLESKEHYGL